MTKEMDALVEFSKAGRRFLESIKQQSTRADETDEVEWDAACSHPNEVPINIEDLEAIIAMMDDPVVRKSTPLGLHEVLTPLREAWRRLQRG